MARHDFAHNEAPIAPHNSSLGALMPVLAILLVALLCFAGGYWLGQAQSGHKPVAVSKSTVPEAEYINLKARFEKQLTQLEELGSELAKWKAIAKRDASSKVGDLQFYKDLPNQSVMPAPMKDSEIEGKSAASRPASTEPAAVYAPEEASSQMLASIIGREMQRSPKAEFRIQAGSFRSLADAQPLERRLHAAGFTSFIEAVDLGDKGVWQRVYVGPFESRGAAEKAKRNLRDKLKISGLLVRKKG
ncbi:MAG: SPOR domain-containing protein [Mariprofundaceae bacterium]